MKKFLILISLFLPFFGSTQELDINVNLDSVDFVRIIDHQNFNFEWYCGRIYEITKKDESYEMYLVEQYNRPFFFGEPEINNKTDSFDISKSTLLNELNISIDQDSAIILANSVVSSKHQFWASRIKIENTDEPMEIETFREPQLLKLISAINDRSSRSPRKILENLDMDSVWIAENASRLFQAYKLSDVEPTKEQKEFCLSCFQDPNKTQRASFSLIGHGNTSDYPYIEIQFIRSSDTLNLHTINPYPLSMPWVFVDSIKYYNPKISLLLAELLPDLEYSNKKRLAGDYSTSLHYKSIEEAFTKSMLNNYCTVLKGKKRRKRIYVDGLEE